jgi:hypothetical protein
MLVVLLVVAEQVLLVEIFLLLLGWRDLVVQDLQYHSLDHQ